MVNNFEKIETIDFESKYGSFKLSLFKTKYKDQPQMNFVLVIHTVEMEKKPLIRVHSSCLYGDTFGSLHCDCQEQLVRSLKLISKKKGILFYLDQEGRGHGLFDKTRELKLQEEGYDTIEASEKLNLKVDSRKYEVVADILKLMNKLTVSLMTNNPLKIKSLTNNGIEVSQIPIETRPNKFNISYQNAKKIKLGHSLKKYL